MKRIPILLVTRPGIGGAAKHVLMICQLIDKAAFEVTVAASPLEDPKFPGALAATGVSVFSLPMRREPHPADARVVVRLFALMRRRHFALVHAHTSKPGLLARMVGAARGVPTLYTPHGFYFHYDIPPLTRAFYREAERFAGRWTTKMVCVTEEEARQAAAAGLVPAGDTVVIPNAVRLEECVAKRPADEVRREFGVPDGAPLLVMVGRLASPKDPFTLLRAAAKLSRPAHVLFAGDGPQKPEVRALARELGLDARVHTPGHRDDALDLTAAADVAVLSSRWEGLPFALLEAMALSRPVVASDISGCRDALGDSGAGRLVAPGSVDAMESALRELIENPAAREEAGRKGRQLIERKYEERKWIAQMQDLYRSVGR